MLNEKTEGRRRQIRAVTTHGLTRSPEYTAYCDAKARCRNPRKRRFYDYGGRGIEFRFESFEQFIAEVGMKPTPTDSIDRIDNDGHYEPGNVKWSTPKEQRRNRRSSRYVTVNGQRRTFDEWAAVTGIRRESFYIRLRCGWCESCAMTNPRGVSCEHRTKT